jgi:hypothetical protein
MALGTLGNLVIRMSADIADIATSISKAEHQFQKFKGNVNKILGTIGVGISVGAFASFIKGTIDAADALNDLRKRTGQTGQELLVLQGAAVRGGVGMEAVSGVVSKLSTRMIEASKGTGDAAAAYQAMGISVKNTDGSLKNNIDLLREVGDRFGEYEDGANKAVLANAALGKGGDALIPVIEALRETEERFKRLGITIDDEVLEAADAFNDKVADLRSVLDVMARQLVAALLPSLDTLVTVLTDATSKTDLFSAAGAAAKTVLETLAILGANVAFVFRSIGTGIGGAIAQIEALARGDFKGFKRIREELTADLAKMRQDLDAFESRVLSSGGSSLGGGTSPTRRRQAPGIPDLAAQKGAQDSLQQLLDQRTKLELEALRDLNKHKTALLDAAHQANLIGELDYWRERMAIQKSSVDAELSALKTQLERQQSELSKAPKGTKDYYAAQKDVEATQAAINKVTREFGQLTALSYYQAQKAADDYRRTIQDIDAQILSLQGKDVEATRLRLQTQNEELRRKFTVNQDYASLGKLDELERLTIAQAEFNKTRERQSEITARLSIEEERIQNSLRTGAISELEALQRTGEARARAAGQLDEIVSKLEGVARASQNPALILQAQQARAELEKLRTETDLLAQKFDTIFKDSFTDAFADFLDGTKSAKEAFSSFADSVVRQINRMVSEALANKLFDAIGLGGKGGGASAIGTFFAGLFGGGSTASVAVEGAGSFNLGGITDFDSYAVGTDYVPSDGLAYLHKGEAVIPASENRGRSVSVNNTFNISGPVDRRSIAQIEVAAMQGAQRALSRDG